MIEIPVDDAGVLRLMHHRVQLHPVSVRLQPVGLGGQIDVF